MDANDLRELANALEPMAKAPRFEDFDVPAFCAWVRACADAEPVAWMHIDGRVISAATMDQAYRDGGAMQSSLREYTIPLYTHPAPAAPHHAMLDSHRRLVEQAIHTAEHPSGMSTHDGKARIDASILRRMLAIIDSLPAAPQAEPLSDVRIAEIQRAAYERAAKECENRSGPIEIYNRAYPHYLECAAAIRALGRQHD